MKATKNITAITATPRISPESVQTVECTHEAENAAQTAANEPEDMTEGEREIIAAAEKTESGCYGTAKAMAWEICDNGNASIVMQCGGVYYHVHAIPMQGGTFCHYNYKNFRTRETKEYKTLRGCLKHYGMTEGRNVSRSTFGNGEPMTWAELCEHYNTTKKKSPDYIAVYIFADRCEIYGNEDADMAQFAAGQELCSIESHNNRGMKVCSISRENMPLALARLSWAGVKFFTIDGTKGDKKGVAGICNPTTGTQSPTDTQTPSDGATDAQAANVSPEQGNAEKQPEMPQMLNLAYQTKKDFEAIPNIARLAKAGIIINGNGWHTEYLDQSRNVLARVDNVDIDKYRGSGIFGKTAIFEKWEDAVIATIDKLTAEKQRENEPKRLSNGVWDIPTIDISLYRDYKAGILTLRECAEEFHRSGWTNIIDEDYTRREFARIEQRELAAAI